MASQEHLDKLKQGVEAWNEWREEHRDIQPDLSGANLSGVDLSNANLNGADLREAQLKGADLREAQLKGANLRNVILSNEQGIGPRLADVQWGDNNLTVVDWSQVTVLGDEHLALQSKTVYAYRSETIDAYQA